MPGVRAATYDGDTPPDERRWIRDHANVVLTNPDLLHHSLLPGHERWSRFLRSLQYVVVDECHVYRGVFGSHVAAVLRRLRRVAARYGASPTFVLASATVSEPAAHAARLVGMPVTAVTDDGSPRGAMTFALWEPADRTTGTAASATTEAAEILAELVLDGVQAVAFARSRAGAEALADERATAGRARRPGAWPRRSRPTAAATCRRTAASSSAGCATGRCAGSPRPTPSSSASTSAGSTPWSWPAGPGARASLWQQAGRAGRSGEESLAVLVAADDPLDTYLVRHPEAIFGAPVEATVMDPHNPHVLAPHLAAAAAELPLGEGDLAMFGPDARRLLDVLVARGILRRRPSGWFWAREDRPAEHISLRGASDVVAVVEARTGRVLGTVDEAVGALPGAHRRGARAPGRHLGRHRARPRGARRARRARRPRVVHPRPVGEPLRHPRARARASAGPGSRCRSARCGSPPRSPASCAACPSGEVLGTHPLDLPERALTTKAVWWTVPGGRARGGRRGRERVPGALHAAEHAAIGMLPLVATSDRWDVGGVSTALHPDTGRADDHGLRRVPGRRRLRRARLRRRSRPGCAPRATPCWACACATGCPACVQSPKCGNGNEPLDKAGRRHGARARAWRRRAKPG